MMPRPLPKWSARFLLVTTLLLLAACGSSSAPPRGRTRALNVRLASVVEVNVVRWRGEPGTVIWTREDAVRTLSGGTVTRRPYRVGSFVTAGRLLLVVGGARARSALARARAAWLAARARARLASRNETRYRALVRQGAVTRLEYEEIRRADRVAKAQWYAAGFALAAARRAESHAVIRAPFPGLIAALPVRLGEDVRPGTLVLRFTGGAAEVRTAVGEALYPHVRLGASVRVRTQDRLEHGRVVALDPALDPRTGTHPVTVLLRRARPPYGAYARVLFSVARERAPVVSCAAFVRRAGNRGVFVVGRDGEVRFALIRAGGPGPRGTCVIRAGLRPGARVVLNPPQDLENGDRVVAGGPPS